VQTQYEVWSVGEVRNEDVRCGEFVSLEAAMAEMDRLWHTAKGAYEIRHEGRRVETASPPGPRSTRPAMKAVRVD
jgi:hypothetical protein